MPTLRDVSGYRCQLRRTTQNRLGYGATLIIRESFKNSAIGDEALSGTTVLDAPQFDCKPMKVSHFAFNILQVFVRYVIDPGTFFRTLRRELQDLPDLVKCKA